MARVVSYNHRPAPYENMRKEIAVDPRTLEQYTGTYDAPKAGKVMVARKQDHLTLSAGGHIYLLFPESDSVFFTKDRDLTFEFVKEGERVSKVVIREHGAVMEEAPAVR